MNGAEAVGWVTALAALGAFAVAAYELRLLRKSNLTARQAEIESVALETQILVRPTRADYDDKRALWRYKFTIHNPGRLPITRLEVEIRYPLPVQRIHFDKLVEDPSLVLMKTIPVIPAHGEQSWERSVLIPHQDHSLLRDTVGTVTFTALDAGRVKTEWPRDGHQNGQNTALEALLRKSGTLAPAGGPTPTDPVRLAGD
jgi:hypothetical protein